MKAIYEYSEKTFLVADIIHLTIGSSAEIMIVHEVENDVDVMYDGKIQNLAFTENGMADPLCDLVVNYMTTGPSGKIILYV